MNASTYMYVCRHNTEDNVKYAARKLEVGAERIPGEPLKFMIWTPSKREIASGQVKFNTAEKPTFMKSAPGAKRLVVSATYGKFDGPVSR